MSVSQPNLNEHDIHLFKEGTYYRAYEKLGVHPHTKDGKKGVWCSVWAPNAEEVCLVGDFNGWEKGASALHPRWDSSGIWEGFIAGIGDGTLYKFGIKTRSGVWLEKADPYAQRAELAPQTASVVHTSKFKWTDAKWMKKRAEHNSLHAPMSVYEVHLGSWRRSPDSPDSFLGYRDLAHELVAYVLEMGYTHIELLPVMEHPFYPSWGYQVLGYFAPTARYGTPDDFKYFVNYCHRHGIGVILDWVPSHFPNDAHGLAQFDGTHLFDHADPRQGFHPDWKSCIFNYSRNEVRSFLISSALFWLDKYHIDGLRVDAVASMLYLDYSRESDQWVPNDFGGRENLAAISLLQDLNRAAYQFYPDVQMIAEESTAWPNVSRPTYLGGLGFGMKWNMGWMNDTLEYFTRQPVHRKYHHNELTFSMLYAFTENFCLSLSHDEVVHGKGSLVSKMPGDVWQQKANVRLLFGYMFAHPGKKLMFMGMEFAQVSEWNAGQSLDWHLLEFPEHEGLRRWVADLNRLYRSKPALYENDFTPDGFRWVDCSDIDQSIISFLRFDAQRGTFVLIVCNFTPAPRHDYHIGVPSSGVYTELLNSDSELYGGSGLGNFGAVQAHAHPLHGYSHSISLTLPPLSVMMFEKNPNS